MAVAQGRTHLDNGQAVTSADIRQIKMNYLQHNKNATAPGNGGPSPVMPKTMEGKAGSQVALGVQH